MFDVSSVFALNTLIRVAEVIKEELEEKNLARKIYFKTRYLYGKRNLFKE